jgi:hypothetical protein
MLRLVLEYPDTTVAREWRVTLAAPGSELPMRVVRADAAFKITGGDHPIWRFRVRDTLVPEAPDLAFWGLEPGGEGALPETLALTVEPKDQGLLSDSLGGTLTFILVPDSVFGGRVFRPRRDERLEDFRSIRLLAPARLGFAGFLEPHMLPDGLQIDRRRGTGLAQRYHIGRDGGIAEMLGNLQAAVPGPAGAPAESDLAFFYRSAPARAGFAWDKPVSDAAVAWAVDRQGRAWRLDARGTDAPRVLADTALAGLSALLASLAGDPPAQPDTAAVPDSGTLAYAWHGGRGRLGGSGDPLLAGVKDWLVRAGLEEVPAFALPAGTPFRFLAFAADTSGLRYTGDTLILERDVSAPGMFRESLSAGSPGRAADTGAFGYSLSIEGDSLIASAAAPFSSRLFGKIDKRTVLFALAGLKPVFPGLQLGLPALTGGSNYLMGRWEGPYPVRERILASPGVKLDARGAASNLRDAGYLFTPQGGLEREFRFSLDHASASGWDKE